MPAYVIRPLSIGPDLIVNRTEGAGLVDTAETFARTIGLTAKCEPVKLEETGTAFVQFTIGTDRAFIVFRAPWLDWSRES